MVSGGVCSNDAEAHFACIREVRRIFIPFIYIGLGIFIVVKSSCYPWSMERINKSTSARPERTILAVVTTGVQVLFVVCCGCGVGDSAALMMDQMTRGCPPRHHPPHKATANLTTLHHMTEPKSSLSVVGHFVTATAPFRTPC